MRLLVLFEPHQKPDIKCLFICCKGFSFDGIVEQLDQSLSNLQTDCVDILYLHHPDRNNPIEETLTACNHLHKRKFITF